MILDLKTPVEKRMTAPPSHAEGRLKSEGDRRVDERIVNSENGWKSVFWLLSVALLIGLSAGVAESQNQIGETLMLGEGEVRSLPAGMYEFKKLSLGKNSTLQVPGSLTLAIEKLESADGASIEYTASTSRVSETKNITIQTLDASGVQFLVVKASGADAAAVAGQGPGGGGGRNARHVGHSLSQPGGRSSHRGGGGGKGGDAAHGEGAANVSMHLPNIKPGAVVRIIANGGNGGTGQRGGNGGGGGDGARGHPPSRGGDGGPGGRGGNGGSAGRAFVYLVVNDDLPEDEQNDLIRTVRVDVRAAGGVRGSGGSGGAGGGGGANGGSGHSRASRGSIGPAGRDGSPGSDSNTNPRDRWVIVDVLPISRYAALYSQTLSKIRAAIR